MFGRNLAILGCSALLLWGAQTERAHTPGNVKAVSLQDNQQVVAVVPPKSHVILLEPFINSAFHTVAFREFLAKPLSVPTKFVSVSHELKTFLQMPTFQENCLTTAVYFESRSESDLGQLAVAMVILNRAETSKSSVCGVVYKGANRFNACQFSFACDGKPDIVDDTRSWKTSADISKMTMANGVRSLGESMQVLTIATNYHADYVSPKWSNQLTRLAKIGRHIFYSEKPIVRVADSRKNYI